MEVEEEICILDLAQRIRQMTGSVSDIQVIPYSQAYGEGFEDMAYRKPNTHRIRDCVGWEPKHQLDEILGRIIDHEKYPQKNSRAVLQETEASSALRSSSVAHRLSYSSRLRPWHSSAGNGPEPAA